MHTKTQILTFLGGTLAAIALSTGTASAQSIDQSPKNASENNLQLAQQPNQTKPSNQSGCACCKTMKEDMEKMRQQMEMMKKSGNSMPRMNHSGTAQ